MLRLLPDFQIFFWDINPPGVWSLCYKCYMGINLMRVYNLSKQSRLIDFFLFYFVLVSLVISPSSSFPAFATVNMDNLCAPLKGHLAMSGRKSLHWSVKNYWLVDWYNRAGLETGIYPTPSDRGYMVVAAWNDRNIAKYSEENRRINLSMYAWKWARRTSMISFTFPCFSLFCSNPNPPSSLIRVENTWRNEQGQKQNWAKYLLRNQLMTGKEWAPTNIQVAKPLSNITGLGDTLDCRIPCAE